MELQWPLILFTTFIAWCAGVFATQCLLAFKGEGKKIQLPCWIITAVLLVIGTVAVFLHLQHWERIFNGFGHLTSGITQELIMIVVGVVVAVVYMVFLRRSDDGDSAPKWICVVGIVVCALLDVIMAHSYMMDSRPAWCNVTEILSILGASCVMGPATVAIVQEVITKEVSPLTVLTVLAGAIVNLVTTLAYLIYMAVAQGDYTYVPFYFDPDLPDVAMRDYSALTPFGGDQLVFTILIIVLAVVAVVCAYLGKKSGKANWKVWGGGALVCGFASALILRVVFYMLGVSVYAFYMIS